VPVPGLVAVAGGKYTTYRIMARDAIDAVARGLDQAVPPSATHVTPLAGAQGFQALWNRRERIAQDSRLHVARIEHLLRRYGTLTGELLQLVAEDEALGRPLQGAEDYLAVEVRYAATHEGALHLDDVLARRTRISVATWDRGLEAAEPAARLMAEPLGWDDAAIAREVDLYCRRVDAERRSQEQPDDRAADLERLSAPDVLSRR
jgi:glycerol-3-phosphate dehydrogenase